MTSQDVDNYKQIKSDLDQLRSIVEKSELWVYKRQGEDGMDADGPSESDNKKKVHSNTKAKFIKGWIRFFHITIYLLLLLILTGRLSGIRQVGRNQQLQLQSCERGSLDSIQKRCFQV